MVVVGAEGGMIRLELTDYMLFFFVYLDTPCLLHVYCTDDYVNENLLSNEWLFMID